MDIFKVGWIELKDWFLIGGVRGKLGFCVDQIAQWANWAA